MREERRTWERGEGEGLVPLLLSLPFLVPLPSSRLRLLRGLTFYLQCIRLPQATGIGYLPGRVIINSCHYSHSVSFVQNIFIWCVDLTIQINIIMILYFKKSLYSDYRNIRGLLSHVDGDGFGSLTRQILREPVFSGQ